MAVLATDPIVTVPVNYRYFCFRNGACTTGILCGSGRILKQSVLFRILLTTSLNKQGILL